MVVAAAFLAGRYSFRTSNSHSNNQSSNDVREPEPSVAILNMTWTTGHTDDSIAAADFLERVSTTLSFSAASASAATKQLLATAHDTVSRAVWGAQLWLAEAGLHAPSGVDSLRAAASAAAAGAAAALRSNPGLGHSALHAAAAAGGWAARAAAGPAAAVPPGAAAAAAAGAIMPWAVSVLALGFALLVVTLQSTPMADESAGTVPVPVPAPMPSKVDRAQMILALEVGMAIGAGSAAFAMWLTRRRKSGGAAPMGERELHSVQ